MGLAWIVTLLALGGAWAGVNLGDQRNRFSDYIAAAGGGILSGIALFWLLPEIGESSGRMRAFVMAAGVAILLAVLDRALIHTGHSAQHGVVWPLLLATAIHSLLDGWSVRLLSMQPWTNVAVTAGLALHKIPEGGAVGWITRRSLGRAPRAFLLCAAVELCTLAGALAEPNVNASAAARFGASWSAGVLTLIAGGFLFLGVHAMLPVWRRHTVSAVFLGTVLAMAALTLLRDV